MAGGLPTRCVCQQVRHQQQRLASIDPHLPGPLRQRDSLAGLTRRYQYDNLGQLLQQDDSRRGVRGYRYDAAGRLLIAQQPGLRETFVFDPAHNLIDQAQHNRDNLPITPGAIRQVHDPLGRLASKTGPDKALHLCWDNDGQLVQSKGVEPAHAAQTGRQTTVTCYAYDPFGRRLAKWNQLSRHSRDSRRTRIHYGWDGNRLLEEDDGDMVRIRPASRSATMSLPLWHWRQTTSMQNGIMSYSFNDLKRYEVIFARHLSMTLQWWLH